jgi:SPP1 gp7 family putative phage head morphogenesis protein
MNSNLKRLYFQRELRKKGGLARLPKLLYPELIEQRYVEALVSIPEFIRSRVNARIKPLLPKLAAAYPRAARADAAEHLTTYYLAFIYPKSWAHHDVLHCTHKYLGKLTPAQVKTTEKIVDAYFAQRKPELPQAVFAREEFFGPENDIRVLTPVGTADWWLDLRAALDEAIRPDDFPVYRPHVTTDREVVGEPFESYALISKNGIHRTWPKTVRLDEGEDLGTLADELEKIRIETTQEFTPEELKQLARVTGKSVDEWNDRQMNGQLSGIVEIDLFGSEPWLARELGGFVVENVSLITSVEDEYLAQVEKMVATSIRSGLRVEEIAADLDDRFDVSRSRAELIARDQVGKFNGQLTELRQKDLGIETYRWMTSGDSRVRDSHRENAERMTEFGQGIYAWNDPPETGHPGQDFQCRCWAEPVLDDLI